MFPGHGAAESGSDRVRFESDRADGWPLCWSNGIISRLTHGPLSAIDRDTLVVGFLSAAARRRAFELDLLQEICAKKITEKCLIVAPTAVTDGFENKLYFELPELISDLYLPPLFVLVGQLLGLSASIREGLRPDEPSPHGAISRVVTHVTLH